MCSRDIGTHIMRQTHVSDNPDEELYIYVQHLTLFITYDCACNFQSFLIDRESLRDSLMMTEVFFRQ